MRIGWLLTTTFALSLCAEVVLTNDTVLKLVRAGIEEGTIIAMVNQQPGAYALSANDLAALKRAGVNEKIIAAMLVRNLAPSAETVLNGAESNLQSTLSNNSGPASSDGEPTRVYVTDSQMIKTLNQRCPQLTVTNNRQKAEFAVLLDHEGGKGSLHRNSRLVVFDRDGNDIFSDSKRAPGNSVKDACQAILRQDRERR